MNDKVLLIQVRTDPFHHYEVHYDDRVEFWTFNGEFGVSYIIKRISGALNDYSYMWWQALD